MTTPFTVEFDEVNGDVEATIVILDDRGSDCDLRIELIQNDVYLIQESDASKDMILISWNMLTTIAQAINAEEGIHNVR